jgi:hypothetical protein
MTKQATESEIRALAGEMVGTLRLISESSGPLTKAAVRSVVTEVEHAFSTMARLVDQLP